MIIVLPWVHCEWVSMALFCIIFIQIQYTKGYFYSCTLWNWNYCAYCKYKWLKKKMKTGWKTDFFLKNFKFWNSVNTSVLWFLLFESMLLR